MTSGRIYHFTERNTMKHKRTKATVMCPALDESSVDRDTQMLVNTRCFRVLCGTRCCVHSLSSHYCTTSTCIDGFNTATHCCFLQNIVLVV